MIGRKKKQEGPETSRQKLLWMHPEALVRFMTSSRWAIQEGALPEDARFHHVYFDQNRQVFAIVVTSNTFEPVLAGQPIPELPQISFRWWQPKDGVVE